LTDRLQPAPAQSAASSTTVRRGGFIREVRYRPRHRKVPWDSRQYCSVSARRAALQICFGPFTLDLDTRQLTRDGRELHLSPKAFELLAALVDERPKVLSKAVLQQRLWPDTFVAEANLSNLVAEIREALGDPPREPTYIRTAHRFGYAFCGEATIRLAPRAPHADRPGCWIEWGTKRFPLYPGEHVVGRDADVEIRLDASTVSRRHARLIVTERGTVLEDFGSKNGTYRGSDRVTEPIHLADGDEIRIGSQLVTFRMRTMGSTDTQTAEMI
jgi:DNA-binding winged helix-turn-helix (wHTH) protein